jgi:hypothetical protein
MSKGRTKIARRLAAIAIVAALTGACSQGGDDTEAAHEHEHAAACEKGQTIEGEALDSGDFAASEATSTVPVTLRDYAFIGLPSETKGPKVLFRVTVEGSNCHEFEVLDAAGATLTEITAFRKGKTVDLRADLVPGTYTVQCLVTEGKRTHADLGMKVALTVT